MPESTSKESDSTTATPPPDVRLRAVQAAQAEGIAVMPLVAGQKKPAKPGWQKEPMPTEAEAEAWAQRANIGFRTGVISGGLFVIDLDPGAQISDLGELPATVTVLTGRTDAASGQRGKHLYFRSTIALSNSTGRLGGNIDTRGDGGFVVAPGSHHPDTGLLYEFAPGLGLGEVEIAELPQHLIDRLTPASAQQAVGVTLGKQSWVDLVSMELKLKAAELVLSEAEPAKAGEAGDNQTYIVACGLVLKCGLPYKEALEMMMIYNTTCSPPWSHAVLDHKVVSALKLLPKTPAESVGLGLRPFSREIVESLGVTCAHRGQEVVLECGKKNQCIKASKAKTAYKAILAVLKEWLPDVNDAILYAASQEFVQAPQVVKEDHEPDVFAVSARRLAATPQAIRDKADALARDPNLLERIADAFERLGLIGLRDAAKLQALTAISRIQPNPLRTLVRGDRSSGKSFLNSLTARLTPPECLRAYSQMSAKSLFYAEAGSLKHRVLILGERGHEDKDSHGEATLTLRELLSEGRASQFTVDGGEDGRSGVERVVEGPVAFIQSTASEHVFAEDLSRCFPIWLGPTTADRLLIRKSKLQRAQGVGRCIQEEAELVAMHHAFQRGLKPYEVVLPMGPAADDLLTIWDADDPDDPRAFGLLLDLVAAHALVLQHQREFDSQDRLVATLEDIEVAKGLMTRLKLAEDKVLFGVSTKEKLKAIWIAVSPKNITVSKVAAVCQKSTKTIKRWFERWCEQGLIHCSIEQAFQQPAEYVFTDKGMALIGPLDPRGVLHEFTPPST